MKKDMNELKKLVHDIMNGQPAPVQHYDVDFGSQLSDKKDVILSNHERDTDKKYMKGNAFHADPDDVNYMEAEVFQDVEPVHEPVSLEEMEKQMIRKTLEKHRGRRKAAAEELKISERTLYRKIKEYGLD